MTALNFILDKSTIIISMDTLASYGETKEPYNFVTKIMPLQHMKMALCGTGNLELILNWYLKMQKSVVANNITVLDKSTPVALRDLYNQCNEGGTGTIYHFGFDDVINEFVGYAYRSTNNFVSEKLNYGNGFKPWDAVLDKHE